MIGLMVVAIVLLSATLIALVVGLAFYFRRLDSAVRELEDTLKATRNEIAPLADEIRRVLRHTNELVMDARAHMDHCCGLMKSVENLVEGKTIVDAAERAVSSSRTTLKSLIYGIKEGLKSFRSAEEQSEEIDE